MHEVIKPEKQKEIQVSEKRKGNQVRREYI